MPFIQLNSTDIFVLIGLIIMSFLFGRFSHLIPFKPFQTAINIKKQPSTKPGKYSSRFYKNNVLEHTKLILCARKDLKMGRGKIAAQCCHATLGVVKEIEEENDDVLIQIWKNYGQPKIVTKIESWGEMKELNRKAKAENLPTHIVCDAGKTHVPSGSYTVLAIGPAPDSVLEGITSHLKLYSNSMGPLIYIDVFVIIGILIMSFLFGRFSHKIPLTFFQRSLENTASHSGKTIGKYSSRFYNKNKLEHTKLILCARKDLKMGRGKLAAQCCHATLGVVKKIENEEDEVLLQIWMNYGQPKIVTKIDSLEQLQEIKTNALAKHIPTYVVHDAGRTQIPSGSQTVLAVGPAPDSVLEGITSHLKLYS